MKTITKSSILSVSLAAALLITPFSSVSHADAVTNEQNGASVSLDASSANSNFVSDDFYAPKVMTEEDFARAKRATVNEFVSPEDIRKNSGGITIMSDIFYSFSGLGAGRSIESKQSVTTTKNTDIYLTLVQYNNYGNPPTGTYYLKNLNTGNMTSGKSVTGMYDHESKTLGWTNVLPGKYVVYIENTGSSELEGNGFANAYYNYD
ncbi:hypothetical protein [Paenibacillus sp. USHLN196]|uniref:hypothetical protein n=1 Tax=Paenibacillus sp. USHLN196 TaxID=3081291 RepID=UPI00301A57B9